MKNKKKLMIQDVMRMLPHRFPMLLVDRVIDLEEGESVVAIKNVTINEPCFQGHFPENPIYPGVMVLESMAQTTAIVSYTNPETPLTDDKVYFFAGINKARFKRQVFPGDQIVFTTKIIRCTQGVSKFECVARVNDKLVCKAELMGALSEVKNDR